jgi:dihydrofolate reductase (trimethoprim resistance protein)
MISLVAAMARNRVIGNGSEIPWKVPGEQKIFRRLTEGKVVVMGRKTHESIGRPLPNRTTIVISRSEGYVAQGCLTASSFQMAMDLAITLGGELVVAGGAEVFWHALPYADRIHLTTLAQAFDGDATFPEISEDFVRTSTEYVDALIPYTYALYERTARAV